MAEGKSYRGTTHRPFLRVFKGSVPVRRCSASGRWGKSADVVGFDLNKMLETGYVEA